MISREPRDHFEDCYFCNVTTKWFSAKTKCQIVYPTMDSTRRPIPHYEGLNSVCVQCWRCLRVRSGSWGKYIRTKAIYSGRFLWYCETSAIVHGKAKFLASRLQSTFLLEKNVRVSYFRKRNRDLSIFFRVNGPLCCCHDTNGLFEDLSQTYDASNWRLFIDA